MVKALRKYQAKSRLYWAIFCFTNKGEGGRIVNIMVIDIELTLNRFGFGKISENKFQFFCFRISKWKIPDKYSVSFEINWRTNKKV